MALALAGGDPDVAEKISPSLAPQTDFASLEFSLPPPHFDYRSLECSLPPAPILITCALRSAPSTADPIQSESMRAPVLARVDPASRKFGEFDWSRIFPFLAPQTDFRSREFLDLLVLGDFGVGVGGGGPGRRRKDFPFSRARSGFCVSSIFIAADPLVITHHYFPRAESGGGGGGEVRGAGGEVPGGGGPTAATQWRYGGRQRRRSGGTGAATRDRGGDGEVPGAATIRPSPSPVDSMTFLRCRRRGCFVWAQYQKPPAARVGFGTEPLHANLGRKLLRRIGKKGENRGPLKGIGGLRLGSIPAGYRFDRNPGWIG